MGEIILLGEIADVGSGNSAPKDVDFNHSEGFPFIRAGHLEELLKDRQSIKTLPKVSSKNAARLKLKYIPENTILVAKSGMSSMLNRVYKVTEKSYFVNHLASIETKETANPDFIKYFLLNFKTSNLVRDESYPSIRLEDIRNIEIPLPTLAEQKAIAEKLDKADALRKKDQELLKYYDELAQSVFIDMFGDPVKNEKGWEKVKTNNFTTKLGDGLHGTPKYSDVGEYFFVNGNNIKNKKIEISEKTRRVDEHEFEKYKKDLNENTIFVSINGTLGSVGFFNNENIVLGKSVCYFNIDPEIADKQYIYHCFDNEYFKRYAEENATGSTIKNVSLKSMREFEVMLPPLSLQQKFANIIVNIEEQKKKVKQQAQESENLFQALLQQSFS